MPYSVSSSIPNMASWVIASYGGSILDTLGVDFDQILTQFFFVLHISPFYNHIWRTKVDSFQLKQDS
jgi:hypothetical protein